MDTETQSVPQQQVIDALVQTDDSMQQSTSCQTEKSEGTNVEVQVDFQPNKNTTGTQTIKQENTAIAMPNKPTSISAKPSKKRKLPSIESPPLNPIKNTCKISTPTSTVTNQDKPAKDRVIRKKQDKRLVEPKATVDDCVLNSEVYQIYCRNQNPDQAQKEI